MLKITITAVTHVLLVEDDADNLKLFTLILEDYHYSVDAYSDPIQALLEFKSNHYDLIILDYLMAKLNGLELYKKIKEIDNSAKVIFLTASIEKLFASDKVQCSKVIRKPVEIDIFLQEIKSALASQIKSEVATSQTDPISV